MAKMRWDKVARENLKKEAALYEQTAFFIMGFGLIGVREVACANIVEILGELEDLIALSYSVVEDVPSMINDRRSKVEKELIRICDQSYDVEIKQAFEDFLAHFKQADLKKYGIFSQYSPIDTIPAATGKGKKKRKASQLTKLELQKQKDDDEDEKLYLEKREKLDKESDDYKHTLLFIESFLYEEQLTIKNQRNILLYAHKNFLAVDRDLQYTIALGKELFTIEEQRDLLLCTYNNVLDVDRDLQYIIASGKELSDQDLSSIVSEYRSKIEKELQSFCDNVSNLTVKEAYARHLDDFKSGFKLSAQDHNSDLQNEDGKIMSSKPKMSVKKKKNKKSKLRSRGKATSGSCKTTSPFDKHLHYLYNRPLYDHRECCKKKNYMETSYYELNFDLMDSLAEEEVPEQEYVVCDDFDDDF